jgi:transcriptional regulator of acetoin/glycerol metabolism
MSNPSTVELRSLADVTHDHILRVVESCNGNQTLAAKVLQIDRKTLYRQLKRNGAAKVFGSG